LTGTQEGLPSFKTRNPGANGGGYAPQKKRRDDTVKWGTRSSAKGPKQTGAGTWQKLRGKKRSQKGSRPKRESIRFLAGAKWAKLQKPGKKSGGKLKPRSSRKKKKKGGRTRKDDTKTGH